MHQIGRAGPENRPGRARGRRRECVETSARCGVRAGVRSALSEVERWLPSPLLQASALLHLAAAAALVDDPSRWRRVAKVVFADHLVLAAAGMTPRSSLLGPNLTRLPGSEARPVVALTFDDGPDPETTPRVLDQLDRAGCTASFFAIGRRAERHPALVAEIVRRGHRIENHTYRHPPGFALLGPRAAGREIERGQATLAALAGRPPRWFRAPAGLRNPWLAGVLAGLGLELASWSRRGFDTVDGDPGRVTRRLTAGLARGEILLLHDGSSAGSTGGRPVVLEVLARVLDVLAARGLGGIALPDPPAPPAPPGLPAGAAR